MACSCHVRAVRMVAGAADAAAAAEATPPAEDAAALLSPTAVAAVDASPARFDPARRMLTLPSHLSP